MRTSTYKLLTVNKNLNYCIPLYHFVNIMVGDRIKILFEIVPCNSSNKYVNNDLTFDWDKIDILLSDLGELFVNYFLEFKLFQSQFHS